MKNKSIKIILIFILSLIFFFITEKYFLIKTERKDAAQMREASKLAEKWFEIICDKKTELGIYSDAPTTMKHKEMLGDDFSLITTTLGSLEAKQTALNPDFAALLIRYFDDIGIDSNSVIGITLSGSFPSLAISTLAAVKIIGAKPIIISSLGASMYGANQPEASWLDIEKWLNESGELGYRSSIVTIGAEDDIGVGLTDEGIDLLKLSAERCNYELYFPISLIESIELKTNLLIENEIDVLVNIGGNHAAVGGCSHSSTIPNGLNISLTTCKHENRGIIFRIAERGVPIIHLLNIKDLAHRYGMRIAEAADTQKSNELYETKEIEKIPILIVILILLVSLWFIRIKKPDI